MYIYPWVSNPFAAWLEARECTASLLHHVKSSYLTDGMIDGSLHDWKIGNCAASPPPPMEECRRRSTASRCYFMRKLPSYWWNSQWQRPWKNMKTKITFNEVTTNVQFFSAYVLDHTSFQVKIYYFCPPYYHLQLQFRVIVLQRDKQKLCKRLQLYHKGVNGKRPQKSPQNTLNQKKWYHNILQEKFPFCPVRGEGGRNE